ncbi:NAD(P)H-dependent oxidoreductase [Aquihabitans sp. McL0605]|uniref:NAD(P)H-dependent oxidoreductase n=1 Tax=Aquihabitans sp. McL0605 TaxID=3415671 RepID=UPI003CEB3A65
MTGAPASPLRTVVVNGSPSHPSRSRTLAEHVVGLLEDGRSGGARFVDLAELDPAALLALGSDPGVDEAVAAVADAQILVVATPVYRATYTALTKTIFDLQPQGALAGSVVIPIATGYGADHRLAIDHGLRPLVASLDGWTTPTGIYATRADLADDGTIAEAVRAAARRAVDEAVALAAALAPR